MQFPVVDSYYTALIFMVQSWSAVIGSDNGFIQNRQKAITWTNEGLAKCGFEGLW